MINIVENTLRDGAYAIDFNFSDKDTYNITKGLAELGFNYIEVGHGLGLGAWNNPKIGLSKEDDHTYITSAKKAAPNAKVGVFFIPGIGTKEDILKAKDDGIDFIRIGANIDRFEITEEYALLAKELGLFTAINLMKSYAVKSYEFTKIVSAIDKWEIADVIYLVDSAGCMMPEDVFKYIDKTKEKVKTDLGFHGHNNLSFAVTNTLQAVKAGATYIDTCIRGMGRSAGNAQTEIVVYLLQKMGITSVPANIYDLYDFANHHVLPLMAHVQGLSDEEIHIGISKFHSSYSPLAEKVSSEFQIDTKRLIKMVSDINCINPSESLFRDIAQKLKVK